MAGSMQLAVGAARPQDALHSAADASAVLGSAVPSFTCGAVLATGGWRRASAAVCRSAAAEHKARPMAHPRKASAVRPGGARSGSR